MVKSRKNAIKSIIGKYQSPYVHYSRGYVDGFFYHQKATQGDKNLLNWIQKDDYFEDCCFSSE